MPNRIMPIEEVARTLLNSFEKATEDLTLEQKAEVLEAFGAAMAMFPFGDRE